MHAALDLPAPDSLCNPLHLRIRGWIPACDWQAEIVAVETKEFELACVASVLAIKR